MGSTCEDSLISQSNGEDTTDNNDIDGDQLIPTVEYVSTDLDVKHKHDKGEYKITAMTFIKDSKSFVVIDHRNRNLKLIDYRFKTQCVLLSVFQPWDIATFSNDFLVVTFPFVRLTQFIKVRSGNCIDHWYPVLSGNEYYGLTVHRDCIVATCRFDNSPNVPSLHYINKDGDIVDIIHKAPDGKTIFKKPSFIAVNEITNTLYVADTEKQAVVALKETGLIINEYSFPNFYPGKITVHSTRQFVFVVMKESGSILQLNGSLVPLKRIVGQWNSVSRPLSVMCCRKTNRLFVSNEGSRLLYILSL